MTDERRSPRVAGDVASSAREMIQLPRATLEIELRRGYLHIVVAGALTDVLDVDEHNQVMERLMRQHRTRRALVDARCQTGTPTPEARRAACAWLLSGRGFEQVAYVLREVDDVSSQHARITGISHRFAVRSFASLMEAHRWLSHRDRPLLHVDRA